MGKTGVRNKQLILKRQTREYRLRFVLAGCLTGDERLFRMGATNQVVLLIHLYSWRHRPAILLLEHQWAVSRGILKYSVWLTM